MRAVLAIVLVLAGLWGGYWLIGSRAMEQAAQGWFTAQQGNPIRAEHQGIAVAGFPNRFDLTVTEPRLTDTQTGISWAGPFAQVFMMTWKPWHVIATLPQNQTLTVPGQEVAITSTLIQGSVIVIPGTDLTLDRTAIAGDGLALRSSAGWEVSATSARFGSKQAADRATAHEVGLELTTLTPDARFRMALAQRSDLPEQIDLLRVDTILGLSAPIDRHATTSRPRLTDITLREGLMRWGDLVLSAKGTLTPAADGTAEGRIDIRVENWRELVPVLITSGLVTEQSAQTLTRALELYARQGSDPTVLTVPLSFQQGWMNLGPLPLGPAPRLF